MKLIKFAVSEAVRVPYDTPRRDEVHKILKFRGSEQSAHDASR